MSGIKFVLKIFLSWRILLFVPLLIGSLVLPFRANNQFTNILDEVREGSILKNSLIYPWANFDGVHYLSIAGKGYTFDGRFMPFYPMLVHLLSFNRFGYPEMEFLMGLIISNVAFVAGLLVFYELLRKDYDTALSKRVVIYLLIFPTAFFFGAIYAEGVFFLLTMLIFFCLNKKDLIKASFLSSLLMITRPIGVCILPVLLYEWYRDPPKQFPKKAVSLLSILISPVWLVIYGLFNKNKWGDYLYFVHAQGGLSNGRSAQMTVLFPQTLIRYIKILLSVSNHQYEWWIALLELSCFIFTLVMLFIAWKRNVKKPYLIFSILAFLVPVSTGTFSGLPRYVIVLFPIFIVLAQIKSRTVRILYVLVSTLLLFTLLGLFARGYYIA